MYYSNIKYQINSFFSLFLSPFRCLSTLLNSLTVVGNSKQVLKQLEEILLRVKPTQRQDKAKSQLNWKCYHASWLFLPSCPLSINLSKFNFTFDTMSAKFRCHRRLPPVTAMNQNNFQYLQTLILILFAVYLWSKTVTTNYHQDNCRPFSSLNFSNYSLLTTNGSGPPCKSKMNYLFSFSLDHNFH